jgi:serine/threonine protein kinase
LTFYALCAILVPDTLIKATNMALKPGDTLLNGQYQIYRQLGRGGFGFVYLAHDQLLGEPVALKELIPALVGDEVVLKRFLAEARATIRLTHERIVRTYNVFNEGGNPAGGMILTSTHLKMTIDPIGEGLLGASLSSPAYQVDPGFTPAYPLPGPSSAQRPRTPARDG